MTPAGGDLCQLEKSPVDAFKFDKKRENSIISKSGIDRFSTSAVSQPTPQFILSFSETLTAFALEQKGNTDTGENSCFSIY